jgi:hypothetical protein
MKAWRHLGLAVAVLASTVTGCTGGSGSSGFDIRENLVIEDALGSGDCQDFEGLRICPADTGTPAQPTAPPTPKPTPTFRPRRRPSHARRARLKHLPRPRPPERRSRSRRCRSIPTSAVPTTSFAFRAVPNHARSNSSLRRRDSPTMPCIAPRCVRVTINPGRSRSRRISSIINLVAMRSRTRCRSVRRARRPKLTTCSSRSSSSSLIPGRCRRWEEAP